MRDQRRRGKRRMCLVALTSIVCLFGAYRFLWHAVGVFIWWSDPHISSLSKTAQPYDPMSSEILGFPFLGFFRAQNIIVSEIVFAVLLSTVAAMLLIMSIKKKHRRPRMRRLFGCIIAIWLLCTLVAVVLVMCVSRAGKSLAIESTTGRDHELPYTRPAAEVPSPEAPKESLLEKVARADVVVIGSITSVHSERVVVTEAMLEVVRNEGDLFISVPTPMGAPPESEIKVGQAYVVVRYDLAVTEPLKGSIEAGSSITVDCAIADPGWFVEREYEEFYEHLDGSRPDVFVLRSPAEGMNYRPVFFGFAGTLSAEEVAGAVADLKKELERAVGDGQ